MSKRKAKGPAQAETTQTLDTAVAVQVPQVADNDGEEELKPFEQQDYAHNRRAAEMREIARSAAEREDHRNQNVIGTDPATGRPAIVDNPDALPAAEPRIDDTPPDPAVAGDGNLPPPTDDGEIPAPSTGAEVQTRRVKFPDGHEEDVPIDRILERGVAAFQKEIAADSNLELAKRLHEDARRMLETAQPKQIEKAPEGFEQRLARLTDTIQYGKPEEARAAMQEYTGLVEERTSQRVLSQIGTTLNARMDHRDAARKFGEDFPDVAGDPLLRELSFSMEEAARANGDRRVYAELYGEIGKTLRERYVPKEKWPKATQSGAAMPAPGAPSGGMSPSNERRERKETAMASVSGAGGGIPARAPPKPKSVTEKINEIRLARGQQPD